MIQTWYDDTSTQYSKTCQNARSKAVKPKPAEKIKVEE